MWKSIPGFENYEANDETGRIRNTKTKRLLKQRKSPSGYPRAVLYNENFTLDRPQHYFIWVTFNGVIPDKLQINHINECKNDNRLSNLELVTAKKNCNHGTRNLRIGEHRCKSVLQFDKNGNFIKEWKSALEYQKVTGKSRTSIYSCCNGKVKSAHGFVWKHKEQTI